MSLIAPFDFMVTQAATGSLSSNLTQWPMHLFERTLVALEEDFVDNQQFVQQFCRKHVTEADEAQEGGMLVVCVRALHVARCCKDSCLVIAGAKECSNSYSLRMISHAAVCARHFLLLASRRWVHFQASHYLRR